MSVVSVLRLSAMTVRARSMVTLHPLFPQTLYFQGISICASLAALC